MKRRLCVLLAIGVLMSSFSGIAVSANPSTDLPVTAEVAEQEVAEQEVAEQEAAEPEMAEPEMEMVPIVGEPLEPGMEFPELSDGWHKLDGNWYWYEQKAPAQGWRYVSGYWYYMDPDSYVMQSGWLNYCGRIYYLVGSGEMQTDWRLLDNNWYYFDVNGAMQTGWQRVRGAWYYLSQDGIMLTGWQKINNRWYFLDNNGAMKTSWLMSNGKWHYLESNGSMATGWLRIGGYWYYFAENGSMQTGWQFINNKWYYLNNNGVMAANRWIDGYYYVNQNGAMVTNDWVGEFYVGSDGRWIPNYDPIAYGGQWEKHGDQWYFKCKDGPYLKNRWQKMNGNWYYFDADGVMASGWKYIGGYKFYFHKEGGYLVQDLTGIIGRQSSYYITVNRAQCQIMVYASDEGGYNIPVKSFACSVGLPYTPTPTGVYNTTNKWRWLTLVGPSYGQYCTQIWGDYLFHSVPSSTMSSYTISADEYNKLGSPASHGCIRMTVQDAKWIYDNCGMGTTVNISDSVYMPFDKPVVSKIPSWQTWDPTDPNL